MILCCVFLKYACTEFTELHTLCYRNYRWEVFWVNDSKVWAILAGDNRQLALYTLLKKRGFSVKFVLDGTKDCETELQALKQFGVVVLPVPTTRDGVYLNASQLKSKLKLAALFAALKPGTVVFGSGFLPEFEENENLKIVDLLKNETLLQKNALATAEAALALTITQTNFTLFKSNVLVFGFGRIAKFLARYCKVLGAVVTVAARRPEVLTAAATQGFTALPFAEINSFLPHYNIVINTVPAMVLPKEKLQKLQPNCFILDLASKPGGVDFKAAESLNLKSLHALSLPGKYAPNSAAEYMAEAIMKNEEVNKL